MSLEGKKCPEFSGEATGGISLSNKDFEGKNLIIFFYPKDNTPGCTKEACAFRDFNRDIQALDTVILGISPDSPESHRRFIDKYSLNFSLLSDPDRKVMAKYGAFGEKNMYGKIVLGVIRSTVWIGPDGKVVKHWKRVPKAADHPAKVYAALRDAL